MSFNNEFFDADIINKSILFNYLYASFEQHSTLKQYLLLHFHLLPEHLNFLSFYNFFSLPIYITKSTFKSFFSEQFDINSSLFSTKTLIDHLTNFYLGNLSTKLNYLFKILSKGTENLIYIENVKYFLSLFLYSDTSKKVLLNSFEASINKIIDYFFNGKPSINYEQLVLITKNENSDLFYLFYFLYRQYLFFDVKNISFLRCFFSDINKNEVSINSLQQELLNIPPPSDSLIDFLKKAFNMNALLFNTDLELLDDFEKECIKVKDSYLVNENGCSNNENMSVRFNTIGQVKTIKKRTNGVESFSINLRTTNCSTKYFEEIALEKNLRKYKTTMTVDKNVKTYILCMTKDLIFIYSKQNEENDNIKLLKCTIPLKYLYLKKILIPNSHKIQVIFYSEIGMKLKKCVLTFNDMNSVEEIEEQLKRSQQYQPFDESRYQIKDNIDKGSFGSIFSAFDKQTNKFVAIKTLTKNLLDQAKMKVIRNEQEISQYLQFKEHDNIIKIYGIYENQEKVYIVQELITNSHLGDYLSTNPPKDQSICNCLIKQLTNALCFLHNNFILHSDIKLENILISIDHNTNLPQLKLIDFGLSRQISRNEYFHDQYGTLLYLSPEIIKNKSYNQRTDIWNYGLVVYSILKQGQLLIPFRKDIQTTIDNIINNETQFGNTHMEIENKYKQLLQMCLIPANQRADINKIKNYVETEI